MPKRFDLYSGTYSQFTERVLAEVRAETFGEDIGQNSWLTADEFGGFVDQLGLSGNDQALEVASGSGGPALFAARRTGCRITGVDADENGVATASRAAADAGLAERVRFRTADANARLPFDDASFDGVLCMDAMNHLPDRALVLREWRRVLRPGRRAVFTDPVVITGPVTYDELVAAQLDRRLRLRAAGSERAPRRRGRSRARATVGTSPRTRRSSRGAGAPRARGTATSSSGSRARSVSPGCRTSSRPCTG